MKTTSGFTIVELLVILVLFGVVGGVGYNMTHSLRVIHRDQDRKVAINTIYTNLQEVVKPKLGGYPRILTTTQLGAMDPSLLKDPEGVTINKVSSDYRYEPTGCNGGDICTGFTLRARIERETDFVKTTI